ncbi:hypothetical protein FRACA_1490003 [Frankia canadensis]|uniref:Uncharacterized protein n=1 Tax=Frankia canadensis TaxID=1836972 RepID=A0A2I2KLS0_9ACTN|nr:hypothetical protein FRACA_1490003 [Frankia canadensis]SOU53901.1 hypothetical protein FRACA_1490003 [Frankia canadensis]
MFDEFNARRPTRRGSREGNAPDTHPDTLRTYAFGVATWGAGQWRRWSPRSMAATRIRLIHDCASGLISRVAAASVRR